MDLDNSKTKALNANTSTEAGGYALDAVASGIGYYWPYGTIASFTYFLLKDYNKTLVKSPQQSFFIPDNTNVK